MFTKAQEAFFINQLISSKKQLLTCIDYIWRNHTATYLMYIQTILPDMP